MLDFAKQTAAEAGSIILERWNKSHRIFNKGKGEFATDADIKSQELIFSRIKKRFPDHDILSEENIGKRVKSRFIWVIDPIDGTYQFTNGAPIFSVSIALLRDYKPILGVINFPALKMLFWSEKGKGAFLNDKKISVSKEKDLSLYWVGCDIGYAQKEKNASEVMASLIKTVRYTPMYGCGSFSTCMVAVGELGAYMGNSFVWDFAASSLIISEAGGKVTDFEGEDLNWHKNEMRILASNGLYHKKFVNLLKQ